MLGLFGRVYSLAVFLCELLLVKHVFSLIMTQQNHEIRANMADSERDWPAELEEDFLKDQDGSGAAQDGERLSGAERVGHPSDGGAEQRLHGTLLKRDNNSKRLQAFI